MSEPCKCSEKFEAVQNVLWQQIKTMSALMERIESAGDRLQEQCDRLQELYQAAEHEREQARAAVIEKYLRKRLEVELENKKGAKGDNKITFNKVEKHIS